MFHLGGFYESVNPAGVLTLINAVTDQAIYTSGNDLRVPSNLAALLAEAGAYAGTTPQYCQVQSPTLRDLANQDIGVIGNAAQLATQNQLQDHGSNPRDLTALESVNFGVDATGGAAADAFGLVWIGDGPVKPTSGKMFSVRCSSAVTNTNTAWANGALTFNSVLPSGTYQVVGMHAEGTGLFAARLVFVGGTYRPGVPGQADETTELFPMFRYGKYGVFGEFDSNQPPTVDCLGSSGTAQDFILDLIKTK